MEFFNHKLYLLILKIVSIILILNHMLKVVHVKKCHNIRSIVSIIKQLTCFDNIIMKFISLIYAQSLVSYRH